MNITEVMRATGLSWSQVNRLRREGALRAQRLNASRSPCCHDETGEPCRCDWDFEAEDVRQLGWLGMAPPHRRRVRIEEEGSLTGYRMPVEVPDPHGPMRPGVPYSHQEKPGHERLSRQDRAAGWEAQRACPIWTDRAGHVLPRPYRSSPHTAGGDEDGEGEPEPGTETEIAELPESCEVGEDKPAGIGRGRRVEVPSWVLATIVAALAAGLGLRRLRTAWKRHCTGQTMPPAEVCRECGSLWEPLPGGGWHVRDGDPTQGGRPRLSCPFCQGRLWQQRGLR